MKTNIDVSLINLKKYKKTKHAENSEDAEENTKIKIKPNNFFSVNEIKICDKIRKISNYLNYYNIISQNSFISVGEMNEKVLETIELANVDNNQKYLLFEYNYKRNTDFEDFLYNLPTPKLFIFHVLDSYKYLLTSLNILQNNNICFFNLSSKNIIFNKNLNPILDNFEKSLITNNVSNQTYFVNIIKEINDFTYKPIEIHLLFYIIANEEERLSYSLMEIICDNYIKNMSILSFFPENYKNSFKNQCICFLEKYINKSQKEIIDDIILYCHKWDNYELSVLYLHIFGNIIRVFSLKETFVNKIIFSLIKNINPDPLKRENVEDSLNNYTKIFNDTEDWSFVNTILQSKMSLLYEVL